MAEVVQISGNLETVPTARPSRGWPKSLRLILAAVASILGLWIVVSPNAFAAVACLLCTLVYASRVWPKLCRILLFAAIPYNLAWTSFIFLRGMGDGSPLTPTVRLVPRRVETWLFGGELPTTVLQRHLFDPAHLRLYDFLFLGVHISFFAVPFLVAMGLCWTEPARGRRFLVALALLLTFALPVFFLLPGNPPWMNPGTGDPNPVSAYRVNAYGAERLGVEAFDRDGRLHVEENSMAVFPSIHMGVTFLLALSAPVGRRRWRWLTRFYACLMAFSLVYLGEHYVIDEIAGITLAVLAWRCAPRVSATIGGWLDPVVAKSHEWLRNRVDASLGGVRARLGLER
ncbi:MAG: hypothetical protein QOF33_4144 [Thermomicrobiales bacterium]|jgi:membrane-associated phospholipid phosphatase|nr:hypothetical protein [Thermomicrobiales bacterium]